MERISEIMKKHFKVLFVFKINTLNLLRKDKRISEKSPSVNHTLSLTN